MRQLLVAASLFALAACGLNGTDRDTDDEPTATPSAAATDDNLADSMASHDGAAGEGAVPDIADSQERPEMRLQVMLDRQGFGPGVIDGRMGVSTENALRGFQEANGLDTSGTLDEPTEAALARLDTIPATRIVRIPANWASLEFRRIPDGPAEQAEMTQLGYESLDERLAERFHTTAQVLADLNPGGRPAGMESPATAASPEPTATVTRDVAADDAPPPSKFAAGQLIRVPNIGADRIVPGVTDDRDWERTLQMLGVGTEQPEVSRVVVSKSKGTLRAYDDADTLVALFTVTSGSSHDPLPLGDWKVKGVAHNPPFSYDSSLFWDVPDTAGKHQLPPGPNGPAGVVWIDLTKEHYGIHGTSEPQTIGRSQSHGCVRLTNWDAARLAEMVTGGTKVLFEA